VAFQTILAALSSLTSKETSQEQKLRVAVFSSPLGRAIGTAAMIGAVVDCHHYKALTFVLPTAREEDDDDDLQNDIHSAIPIVVWNSLCDCAAQIASLGGHRNVIRTGFLHCAATRENCIETFASSPMQKEWKQMVKRPRATSINDIEKDDDSSSVDTKSHSIQFWKPDDNKEWVPMTPDLSLLGDDSKDSSATTTTLQPPPPDMITKKPLFSLPDRETHASSSSPGVNQVVCMSIDSRCDVCIIVSHREEIRDLYQQCGYHRHDGKNIPYCGIGLFQVEELVAEQDDLRWTLHGLVPPDELTTRDRIRSMMFAQPPKTSNHRTPWR
jgi:hypothetical protein